MLSFAARSGCEEIGEFCGGVRAFAKSGAAETLSTLCRRRYRGRIEVEREVATVLAGKRLGADYGNNAAFCNSGISSGGIGRISGRFQAAPHLEWLS